MVCLDSGRSAPAGYPPHGLVVVGVDGGQPWDERCTQQLAAERDAQRVIVEDIVDDGLHDSTHFTDAFASVVLQRELTSIQP